MENPIKKSEDEWIEEYLNLKRKAAKEGSTWAKGDLFEKFVSNLFPETKYQLINYTPRREDLNRRQSYNSYKPDFLFKRKDNEEEFYIECKYRSSNQNGKITICKFERLIQYKKIEEQENKPIYLMIGLDGEAENPYKTYMVPINKIYPKIYISYLKQYEIKTKEIAYNVIELLKKGYIINPE